MAESTLESLVRRVESLEAALAAGNPTKTSPDWRKAVGMFAGSEFMKQVDEEGRCIREAEREAARREAESENA